MITYELLANITVQPTYNLLGEPGKLASNRVYIPQVSLDTDTTCPMFITLVPTPEHMTKTLTKLLLQLTIKCLLLR